ncbi:MAG: ammonium transporter [Firmicutes bacterium]|nr:ammonium transporter [Bacillota bacterium]
MVTAINTVWVAVAGALVFFMEGGFALLEAGLVQAKNTLSIVMKVTADVSLGSLVYALAGFGLMFGFGNGWAGWTGFFAHGPVNGPASVPVWVFWFFEMAFAVAAISIVSGAVSERMRFDAYLLYIIVGILAYSLAGHWIWNSQGWLNRLGMEDFAGSAVVHTFGGFSALAAAWMVGPRTQWNGGRTVFRPSNLPLAFAGTFILWFGWFGFNGGSTLNAFSPLVGPVIANTMLAAAAGGLAAVLWSRIRSGHYDAVMAINGVLSGLVAITAGAGYLPVWASLPVGIIAGLIVVEGTPLVTRLNVDDPVGAVPVHGFNGLFGTLAVGLFAGRGGLLTTGHLHLLAVQALGAGVVAVWAFAVTAGALGLVQRLTPLRVTASQESIGLDWVMHGSQAYAQALEGSASVRQPRR